MKIYQVIKRTYNGEYDPLGHEVIKRTTNKSSAYSLCDWMNKENSIKIGALNSIGKTGWYNKYNDVRYLVETLRVDED